MRDMSRFLILFNHILTEEQGKDAIDVLQVKEFCYPPAGIGLIWKAIPPEAHELRPLLEPVFQWIDETASAGDYLLVQGDFGATWMVVEHAMKKGIVPVYSTTERRASEKIDADGTVHAVHEFRHVRFRQYGK